MKKQSSVWESSEVAKEFLENERGAVPGTEIQLGVILKAVQLWNNNPKTILDLGCGNGILGKFLLTKFPDSLGIFVDVSDAMLDAAAKNLEGLEGCKILKADFSNPDWLDAVESHKPFDIVISGFAIHHQPDDRKETLYSEVYDLLSPGGIFFNMEHVISSTQEVEKLFEQYYIDHLHIFRVKSDPDITREEVAESFMQRADKDENKLTSVEEQCDWLRDIGFRDVDCFFKLFEIAIFGGRKS